MRPVAKKAEPLGPRYDVRFRNGTYHVFDRAGWRPVSAERSAGEAECARMELAWVEASKGGRRYAGT